MPVFDPLALHATPNTHERVAAAQIFANSPDSEKDVLPLLARIAATARSS